MKDLALRDEYALLIQKSGKGTFNWIYFEEMIVRWSKPLYAKSTIVKSGSDNERRKKRKTLLLS